MVKVKTKQSPKNFSKKSQCCYCILAFTSAHMHLLEHARRAKICTMGKTAIFIAYKKANGRTLGLGGSEAGPTPSLLSSTLCLASG